MALVPISLTVGLQGLCTFGDQVDADGELLLYHADGDVDWISREEAQQIVDHLTAVFGLSGVSGGDS